MMLKTERLGAVGGIDLQGLSAEEGRFQQCMRGWEGKAMWSHLRPGKEESIVCQRQQKTLITFPLSCFLGYGGIKTR